MKKSFLEKLIELDLYAMQKDNKKDKKKEESLFKMPIKQLVFLPFAYLVDHFKSISVLFLSYSVIITLVSIVMGYPFICMVSKSGSGLGFCRETGFIYFAYVIIKLFIVSNLMVKYYLIVSGEKIKFKDLFNFDVKTLRTLAVIFVWCLLHVTPFLSLQILMERVPNPDVFIESVFFTFVSLGFVFPFIIVRFYAVFGYFIETGKVISLKYIWKKTRGNGVRVLLALLLILICSMLIFANYFSSFGSSYEYSNIIVSVITSEFLYNIVVFIAVSLAVGHLQVQRTILIDKNIPSNDN